MNAQATEETKQLPRMNAKEGRNRTTLAMGRLRHRFRSKRNRHTLCNATHIKIYSKLSKINVLRVNPTE